MTGASRHTASLSLPSITGGVVARCATAVVALGAVGGAGEEPVCRARMTAATGASGIMHCPWKWGPLFGCYDSTNGWFRDTLPGPLDRPYAPSREGIAVTFTRLWSDRRTGNDRRSAPRRQSVMIMPEERRRVVDRRRGSERRSTLDRRGRSLRAPNAERPVEHVRNALQLLREVALVGELSPGP